MSESLLIIITIVGVVVVAVSNHYKAKAKDKDKAKSKQSEDEKSEMKKKQKRFITLTFFGTTNSYQDDVNPYDSIPQFMANSVGTLNWGIGADIRGESKHHFADTFHGILKKYYKVYVHPDTVVDIISDDKTMLKDAIDRIVEKAAFPPI